MTFGENYGCGAIGQGFTAQTGMAFLTSTRYGQAWVGNLFVGSLKFGDLHRIELAAPFEGKMVREHKLLAPGGERIRDVRRGPPDSLAAQLRADWACVLITYCLNGLKL